LLLSEALVFLAYFAAGELGLAVPFTSYNVSPVWPAAGIGLAAVLMWGGQMIPAIALAAFLVNYLNSMPVVVALAIGLGNASSAAFGAYLLSRVTEFEASLPRLRDLLQFTVLAAIVGAVAAPTVGVTAQTVAHIKAWSGYASAWPIWWLGDAMGVLVVAPLFLTAHELIGIFRSRRALELVLIWLGILAASTLIFGPFVSLRDDVLAFVVFPFILWAAIRFRSAGAASANVVAAAFAIWRTAHGSGPFVNHAPLRNAELLQFFIAVTSLTGLMVAAVISERRQIKQAFEANEKLLTALGEAQSALAEAHHELENRVRERTAELNRRNELVAEQAELLDLASDAILVRTPEGRITYWNRGAERLYGWTRDEVIGATVHEILRTEFPVPIGTIQETIVRTGSWEGELSHLKRDGNRITVGSRWSLWSNKEGKILGFLELNSDVTLRKRAEQSLRELSGKLLTMQDEERRRIARELHDSAGQMVAALSMNLAAIENDYSQLGPRAQNACSESIQLVQQMSSEIRTISHLLHPPLLDEAGLPSALGWYVDGFSDRSKIAVSLDLSPDLGRLSPEVETAIFRIVQECLTNIHRHSQSATAAIRIARNGRTLELEVRDQGQGIPMENIESTLQERAGVGVQGMRERVARLGGQFEIRSSKNGTVVRANLPLPSLGSQGVSGFMPKAS